MLSSAVFMNSMKVAYRCFSTLPSTPTSSLPWISPLQFLKTTSSKRDLPSDATTILVEARRKPKYISHESAINLIKRERDPQRALEIFNKVSDQTGFNHNNATYATILDKLAWSKKFQAIDAVLHQMTYDVCRLHEGIFLNLMKYFSKSSLHERVLEMFYAIQTIVRQKPSLKAISTCLNLLVESNQIDLARTFLVNTKKNLNLEPNTCIFNILVKHHCKKGDLESAFQVMEEMKKSETSYPNLITYSTLMDGLCQCGKLKEAVDLFEEMVSKDQIVPDALTYNVLINGFSCRGKVDQGKKVIEFMKKNGCNPNIFNYSALVNGFCKEGKLEEAIEAFDEMKSIGLKPDTVGYTTLIDSFCKAGRVNEAMELLREMAEKGCRADTVTFNVLFGELCREGRFEEALRMLYQLPYEGYRLNKASYRIVLNFLLKEGELGKAVELLCLMLGRGFVPHFATSNELLVRLCEAGKVPDAAMVLSELVEMGFKPEPDSWSLLVELICRERRLLPAFELIDELVMTSDWCINSLEDKNELMWMIWSTFNEESKIFFKSKDYLSKEESSKIFSYSFKDLLAGYAKDVDTLSHFC